jgi:hypothetical protein
MDQLKTNYVCLVAMTRAKRHLAIICDMKTLDGSKTGAGDAGASMVDRTLLTKWMEWLGKQAVIQHSNNLDDLPV